MPQSKEVQWNGKAFKKMKNLKVLVIENACFPCGPKYFPNGLRVLEWKNYPSLDLPSDFHRENLRVLNLCGSSLRFVKPLKNFGSLTELVLRGSHFLKEVPDVSGAVNLRELDISYCRNLIKVPDSVGLLDKLVRLYARSCRNLRILPRSIRSASLESLDLSCCYSLQTFPQILGFSDCKRNVIYRSPVRPLNGRMRLSCHTSMLPILENSKDVFQHSSGDNPERANAANPAAPVSLFIHNGPIVNNLANRYLSNWRPYYNKLTNLELPNCNLRDEFLYQLPHWFPCLSYLDVTKNNFTILPECMNGCLLLEILILDSCRDLREIKGIPPNIKRVWALDCMSLISPSSSKLLSQAFHEDGGRFVAVPGYRIPKWIDHRCKRTSISFWCRNEFPRLVVCYIGNLRTINFRIFINGIPVSPDPGLWSPSRTPVIILLDVLEWLWDRTKIVLKENEWNHVSISLDLILEELFIYEMGVHAYKETCTDNVRFIDPIDHNLDLITGFSLQKNFCPFLHMQVCDTKDSRKLTRSNFCRFLNGEESSSESLVARKEMRTMKAPTKVKFLVWTIFDRSLLTCHELFIRELVNSPMCPICEREIETIDHVFLRCPWSRLLWFGSDFASICRGPRSTMSELINWDRDNFELMGHILWVIWKARNDFILSNKPVDPYEALITAKATYMDYSSNTSSLQIERTPVGPSLDTCTSITYEENVKDIEVEYNSNTEMEPTCDKGIQVENRAKRNRGESKSKPEIELYNKDLEQNKCFTSINQQNVKGTEAENKAKRKRKRESNSNTVMETNCEKDRPINSEKKRKRNLNISPKMSSSKKSKKDKAKTTKRKFKVFGRNRLHLKLLGYYNQR